MIPFVNLAAQYAAYKEEIDSAIASVLESGTTIGGKSVDDFEEALARDAAVEFALSCASGTSALALSLAALGLKRGDEVILPDYTFVATADAVVMAKGTPRFADVGNDFLISPDSVEERISPKTVGIVAVDLFGQCADYPKLWEIAERHGLWILEDAAQSLGAFQGKRPAGSLGTVATTSFYPTKPFGAYGDGGAVLTDDETIYEKVRNFARHGRDDSGRYSGPGTNSRLDGIQAAILLAKRKHLKEELSVRERNARAYDEFFSGFSDFRIPKINGGNTSVRAQYALQTPNRDAVVKKFSECGVPTRIYYPRPLSAEPFFAKFPDTEKDAKKNVRAYALSRETFCLPICAFTDVGEIISKIKNAL